MFALTPAAAAKVSELLLAEGVPEMMLRVAVRSGGCSGYSYEIFFDADQTEEDLRLEIHGVPVLLDPVSLPLLESATLDFKDGLQGAGFKMENPGAQRTCGCGQSFS